MNNGREGMNAAPPFTWDQIESADYREYVANLRAVGCPEQVIQDMICAELNQLFAPRVAAVWQRRCPLYWQKWVNEHPRPEQVKQLQVLEEEHTAMFKELTGAAFDPQSFIDTLCLQVWGGEKELLFLPADRQKAALEALRAPGYQEKLMKAQTQNQDYLHTEEFFEEKVKILATVLTPEEVEEYRLRSSHAVVSLRGEVQYFDCTVEEFKALLKLRRRRQADFFDRTAVAEEVRPLFGEARAKEFARVTDMFYANARRIAEDRGLPVESAERAWQITDEARAKANQVAKDPSLSAEGRQQQVKAMREQAEVELKEALGEKPSRQLRRDLANVLWPLEGGRSACGQRR